MTKHSSPYDTLPVPAPEVRMFADAAAQPNREITSLAVGGGPVEVRAGQVLSQVSDEAAGTKQELEAVVSVGHDLYCLVWAKAPAAGLSTYMVTRAPRDGESTATVVGRFSKGQSLAVGAGGGLPQGAFGLRMNDTEHLEITDVSVPGTRLLEFGHGQKHVAEQVPVAATEAVVAKRGLLQYLGLHRRKYVATAATPPAPVTPDDPLGDAAQWSVPPVELHESLFSELYRTVEQLMSPQEAARQAQLAAERIESSETLRALRDLRQEDVRLSREGQAAYEALGRRDRGEQPEPYEGRSMPQIDADKNRVRASIKQFSPADQAESEWLMEQLGLVGGDGSYQVEADDTTAQMLMGMLQSAVAINPTPDTPAPFAGWAKNTDDDVEDARTRVTDDQVRDYFAGRPFASGLPAWKSRSILITPPAGGAFDVRTDLLVGLSGFSSWLGQDDGQRIRPNKSGRGPADMRSLDVAKQYASLPTELPPAGEMRVLVQPDGKILCDNAGGDSHRILAALLRGDSTVKTGLLKFTLLPRNVL